jgi:hypothetical protein
MISFHREVVYNSADPSGSAIVWARNLAPESLEKLARAFPGRTPWCVVIQPDSAPTTAAINQGACAPFIAPDEAGESSGQPDVR